MRIVIDTNVFVSSFFGGNPKQIIDLWKQGKITLCFSPPIIDEYTAVLQRLGVEEKDLKNLLSLFARGYNCLFTGKTPDLHIVHGDPDDDKFIECAVALNAKFVVSGDKAITSLSEYMGIKLVTPKTFLEEYYS
jgi:putative PIN family toxin of toxin-antitoxin system